MFLFLLGTYLGEELFNFQRNYCAKLFSKVADNLIILPAIKCWFQMLLILADTWYGIIFIIAIFISIAIFNLYFMDNTHLFTRCVMIFHYGFDLYFLNVVLIVFP